METVSLSLPEPMRRWIESLVESGRYADASDYLRDLIRHDHEDAVRDHVQKAIDPGMQHAEDAPKPRP